MPFPARIQNRIVKKALSCGIFYERKDSAVRFREKQKSIA
jgi:hypothetical protein